MRKADRDEIWTAAMTTPREALERGLERSKKCYTGLYDGVPVVMFGVCENKFVMYRHGSIWLLGTDDLEKYQVSFLRYCQRFMPDLTEGFHLVENYIDSRNTKTMRWLRWLRFDIIEEPILVGEDRVPFFRFEMRAK